MSTQINSILTTLSKRFAPRRLQAYMRLEKWREIRVIAASVRKADLELRSFHQHADVEVGVDRRAFARNRSDVEQAIARSRKRLALTR